MKNILATILISSLACGPVFADALSEKESYRQLYEAGAKAAGKHYKGGYAALAGFPVGLFLPLAGPFVVTPLTDIIDVSVPESLTADLSVTDKTAFVDGYKKKAKALRRSNFILSGLVGTATFILLFHLAFKDFHGIGV